MAKKKQINKVTYRTQPLHMKADGGDLLKSGLEGGMSGATAGMALGPWGALAGGVLGAGASMLGTHMADQKPQGFNNFNIPIGDNVAQQFAMGGPMGGNPGQGSEQLNEFNGGGTHEQNPIGGIPVGNGNSVEDGETELKSENYVFSDRLYLNEQLASEYGFSKKHLKMTFAELSKDIDKKYGTRSDDTIDENSKKIELDRLMEAQEFLKAEQQAKDLAKFAKAQPELFAQMQQQSQQQGPQQPQGQMPQGPQMEMPGQMAMGGYRKQGGKQYAGGGFGEPTPEQQAALWKALQSGQIDYAQYNERWDGIVSGQNLNKVDSKGVGSAYQTMPDYRSAQGYEQKMPDFGEGNYDYQMKQLDELSKAGKINAAEYSELQKQIANQYPTGGDTKEFTVANPEQASQTYLAPKGYDSIPDRATPQVDPSFTPYSASSGDESGGTPRDETPFEPGTLNTLSKLAPIAYNLYQGLKPEDKLNAGDYKTNESLSAPTMNIDPTLRRNTNTYQSQSNAIRSGAGGSGGSYLANMGQAQLNKQVGDSNAYIQKSNYDNQMQMSADQFNIGIDQRNKGIQQNIDDWNAKSLANKESHMSDAAHNIASLGHANTQDRMNAYGISQRAGDYKFMFNNYLANKNKG